MIERYDSQQTTCSVSAVLDGERQQVASASCSIRPGRSMGITVDLNVAPERLDEETLAEIRSTFGGYLAAEMRKAADMGIPVGPAVNE